MKISMALGRIITAGLQLKVDLPKSKKTLEKGLKYKLLLRLKQVVEMTPLTKKFSTTGLSQEMISPHYEARRANAVIFSPVFIQIWHAEIITQTPKPFSSKNNFFNSFFGPKQIQEICGHFLNKCCMYHGNSFQP